MLDFLDQQQQKGAEPTICKSQFSTPNVYIFEICKEMM